MMTMQTIKFKDLNANVKELLDGGFSYSLTFDLSKSAPINIPYGQKLYMMKDNELIAVKILMATYITSVKDRNKFSKFDRHNSLWCYLVQTPYGTEWRNDMAKNTMFFHTKEEYFEHLETGLGGFKIEYESFAHITNKGFGNVSIKHSWKWNGHCAEPSVSLIKHVVINENGINIIINNQQDDYWTKDDCTKANIDGLKIVDFPETEHSIKVSIEVVKNEPIVRTLTFMEK